MCLEHLQETGNDVPGVLKQLLDIASANRVRDDARVWINSLEDEKMPQDTKKYLLLLLSACEKTTQKRGQPSKSIRDIAIAEVVFRVTQAFCVDSERNEAERERERARNEAETDKERAKCTYRESGCSIVQKALEQGGIRMDERNIETIFQRSPYQEVYKRLHSRGYSLNPVDARA
jgi:hypothetical protein